MAMMVPRVEVEPGIWLDARRALWLESARCLVVADLHWGYAASHRSAGNLLPAWGDDEIAATLQALILQYGPDEMIWLGDVIHAAPGRSRAEAYLAAAPIPVALVRGNHDRGWRNPALVPQLKRGGFLLHHGDTDTAPPGAGTRYLVGHHHPAVVWGDAAGSRVKLPALLTGPRRWILPAFSPWAAGVPWNGRVEPGETLWAIAPRRIFPLRPRLARPS
jgi:uncharacterized protein